MIATITAVCSLAFTVGSFWWLFARQGKLVAYEPHSFAAQFGTSFLLLLRFPLVFEATGPRPIVIQDLRLTFPDEPDAILPFPWRSSRVELQPSSEDGRTIPAVFAIEGRKASQYFIEFGAPFPGFALQRLDYRVLIEVRMGHKKGWHPLLDFTLRAGNISHPEAYITYSNAPFEQTPAEREKVSAALERLRDQLLIAERARNLAD